MRIHLIKDRFSRFHLSDEPEVIEETGVNGGNGFVFDESKTESHFLTLAHSQYWTPHDTALYDILITPKGNFAVGQLATKANSEALMGDMFPRNIYKMVKIYFTNIVRTTKEFRNLDPAKRNCLFKDEASLEHFPVYTEANCMVECAWRHAKEICLCVPWFLKGYFPEVPLCELFGNKCFRDVVDTRYKRLTGLCRNQCLPDCEITEFTIKKTTNKRVFTSQLCNRYMKGSEEEKKLICGYYEEKFDVKDPVMRALAVNPNYEPDGSSIKYVRIYPEGKTTMKILMTATVTIIDMISNIGGTLGLFSGFSILSGCELIYWTCQCLGGKKKDKSTKLRGKRVVNSKNKKVRKLR